MRQKATESARGQRASSWKRPSPASPSPSSLSQKLPALSGELGYLGKNLITKICFLFIYHVLDSVLRLWK